MAIRPQLWGGTRGLAAGWLWRSRRLPSQSRFMAPVLNARVPDSEAILG